MDKPTKPAAVAYMRVSTADQGNSGNGLDAQRETIRRFTEAEGYTVAEWVTEVETGKGYNAMERRPKLAAALKLAQKLRAPLVVSKLDRLSRDVAFISALMVNQRTHFISVEDGKGAEPLQLHIRAVIAEEERRKIGIRTREALAALKRRGVKLGNPNNESFKRGRRKAVLTRMIQADAFAQSMLPIIQTYQRQGMTLQQIAEELNQRNMPTARGGRWYDSRLAEMLQRVKRKALG